MATSHLSLASAGAAASWLVLVLIYGALALVAIGGAIGVRRGDEPARQRSRRTAPRPTSAHLTLRPVFLTSDGATWVLDTVVDGEPVGDAVPAGAPDDGEPVALELLPPNSAWLGLVLEGVLANWVNDDRSIDLDFSKVDRPHPAVGLSSDDTHLWLELASASPGLPGSTNLHPSV